jgi:hypothetical protein
MTDERKYADSEEKPRPKKSYEPPVLRALGSVQELTLGAAMTNPEGVGMMAVMM